MKLKPFVLVVDDEDHVRLVIKMIIGDQAEFHEAADKQSALDIIRRNPGKYYMGFLDYRVPGANAFEEIMPLFRELNPQAAVILISGSDLSAQIRQVRETGADGVQLGKPFSSADLLRVFAEASVAA